MDHQYIISSLQSNASVFKALFSGLVPASITWKPSPDKWSLIEVICHLYDEEREDFRERVESVLTDPEKPFRSINPVALVTERKYIEQDIDTMLGKFLEERAKSVSWLQNLKDPKWNNAHNHPKVGPVKAEFLLANWLAHDYIHIRQANRLKYEYLHATGGVSLDYAGEW